MLPSNLPGTPEPDVRVRVRRGIVQVHGERARIRAIVPVRPPQQSAAALPRFWSVATCEINRISSLLQCFTQIGKGRKGNLDLGDLAWATIGPFHLADLPLVPTQGA